ncbi:MAG: ABC transporter substrate-binding protein [Steroidobacteraceae bacterium]|nr:ABC transporter substrate-binding protein [Steroidobacteraceae bacterium]
MTARITRRATLAGVSGLCMLAGTSLASGALARTATPRVISVGGSLTEIVYALGAGEQLVGVDTTSAYPEAATRLPKVGYLRSLSAEGLLSLRPTLLIAAAQAGPPVALRQVESAGTPLVRGDEEYSYAAVRRNVATIGRALDRDAATVVLAARLDGEWAAATAAVPRTGTRPRALFVLAHTGANVQISGTGTAAHAMLELAGARNAAEGFAGYRPLTAEGAVAAAPDFIVATRQGVEASGGVDRLLQRPGLALTPAGRARRVVAPEASFLLGFGPRLPGAVAELAAAFAA